MFLLTANTDLTYRLFEKPTRGKDGKWDGFPVRKGDSIRITTDGLKHFVAVDVKGKRTTDFAVTPHRPQ